MVRRCPTARAVGPAVLDGYEFFVGVDGWGSVKRKPGAAVHGMLWRLKPRDMAALHAYELLYRGLHEVRDLPVRLDGKCARAMIYLLRRRAPGRPKPGYVELIGVAARAWKLPERCIRSVERWSVSRFPGARMIEAEEVA